MVFDRQIESGHIKLHKGYEGACGYPDPAHPRPPNEHMHFNFFVVWGIQPPQTLDAARKVKWEQGKEWTERAKVQMLSEKHFSTFCIIGGEAHMNLWKERVKAIDKWLIEGTKNRPWDFQLRFAYIWMSDSQNPLHYWNSAFPTGDHRCLQPCPALERTPIIPEWKRPIRLRPMSLEHTKVVAEAGTSADFQQRRDNGFRLWFGNYDRTLGGQIAQLIRYDPEMNNRSAWVFPDPEELSKTQSLMSRKKRDRQEENTEMVDAQPAAKRVKKSDEADDSQNKRKRKDKGKKESSHNMGAMV